MCALLRRKKIIMPAQCNRPFPSYFEPHYESEASCKVFIMKISFYSYAKKKLIVNEKLCTLPRLCNEVQKNSEMEIVSLE